LISRACWMASAPFPSSQMHSKRLAQSSQLLQGAGKELHSDFAHGFDKTSGWRHRCSLNYSTFNAAKLTDTQKSQINWNCFAKFAELSPFQYQFNVDFIVVRRMQSPFALLGRILKSSVALETLKPSRFAFQSRNCDSLTNSTGKAAGVGSRRGFDPKTRWYNQPLRTSLVRSPRDWTAKTESEEDSRLMQPNQNKDRVAICLVDDEPDLKLGKVYRVLRDALAERDHWVRIIDESREDYLYPENSFFFLRMPLQARKIVFGFRRKPPH